MPALQKNLLDPAVLAKLSTLKLRMRAIVDGILSGQHKSPHQGQSVEFAEHKEYTPGDELRHIDWKAYGKFDKYYVKRFEQESNLRAYLVVDASGSMGYRSRDDGLTKLEYASALAASLAYLLVRQQDAVGLLAVQDAVTKTIAPRAAANHLGAIVDTLGALQASGETSLGAAVDLVVERAPRRMSVVVISDLFDRDERILKKLSRLRKRKHDVTVFHTLDPAEISFPFHDPTLFLSMEDARNIEAHGRDVRKGYLELFGSWLEETRRSCAEIDIDYNFCPTDQPLDQILLPFLARRERRAA